MKVELELGPRFKKDFKNLDKKVQERVLKALDDFSHDQNHPSFRLKPMKGQKKKVKIWEAHISLRYVFTFEWLDDEHTAAYLRRVGKHDIYGNP